MSRVTLRRVVFAALCLMPLAAFADDGQPYVTAAQVDLVALLPPPPAAGGSDARTDLEQVERIQRQAGAGRRAVAVHDGDEHFATIFGPVLGSGFAPARVPLTEHLFERLGDSESAVVDPAKKVFGRPRPFMVAKDAVHPLGHLSKSGSYPSGHTTRATLEAVVLAEMLPERRQAIWTRARQYAYSRIVCGVHYPRDIEAGVLSGEAIATAIRDDAQFRHDYMAARAELRAALGMTP